MNTKQYTVGGKYFISVTSQLSYYLTILSADGDGVYTVRRFGIDKPFKIRQAFLNNRSVQEVEYYKHVFKTSKHFLPPLGAIVKFTSHDVWDSNKEFVVSAHCSVPNQNNFSIEIRTIGNDSMKVRYTLEQFRSFGGVVIMRGGNNANQR